MARKSKYLYKMVLTASSPGPFTYLACLRDPVPFWKLEKLNDYQYDLDNDVSVCTYVHLFTQQIPKNLGSSE
jgi:hypothetical protein